MDVSPVQSLAPPQSKAQAAKPSLERAASVGSVARLSGSVFDADCGHYAPSSPKHDIASLRYGSPKAIWNSNISSVEMSADQEEEEDLHYDDKPATKYPIHRDETERSVSPLATPSSPSVSRVKSNTGSIKPPPPPPPPPLHPSVKKVTPIRAASRR